MENKDFEKAYFAFTKAAENNNSWAEPYYEMAKISFLNNDIEKGINYIRVAFELNPEEKFDFDFQSDWKKVLEFLMTR